jgi:hypothetical protein
MFITLACMKYTLIVLALVVGVSACKVKKQAAAKPEYRVDLTCGAPFDDKEIFSAKQADYVPVDTAYIEGDCLHILTGKINLCDANRIKLAWNGALAKSLPPQASFGFLIDKDPECKEEAKYHLTYGLTLIRMRNIGNKITIKLKGTPYALTYNFTM